MKLNYISFLDISRAGFGYTSFVYTYVIRAKSLFSTKLFKLKFTSPFSHLWWTDIQSSMISCGIYFEDLLKEKSAHIPHGNIEISRFSSQDEKKWGTTVFEWQEHCSRAIDQAHAFQE